MADIQPIDAAEENHLSTLQHAAQGILLILQQAKLALEDLNHENDLEALKILRRAKEINKQAIHEILQARVSVVASREREALIILEKQVDEIKVLAEEAEQALMRGKRRKAKKLLQRLIKISSKAVEQEKRFVKIMTSSGAILGYQVAFDGAVAYLVYKLLNPYAVRAGHAIDEMVFTMEKVTADAAYFKNKVENYFKTTIGATDKAGAIVKHTWDTIGKWTEESVGIKLPGAEEPVVLNPRAQITRDIQEMRNTAAKHMQKTQKTYATVGVPPPPPPQLKDTFEKMVPDLLMFAIGGAVIFVFIRYHLPSFIARLWRRRQNRANIERIVSEIERRNELRFRHIIAQLEALTRRSVEVNSTLLQLHQHLSYLGNRIISGQATPEEIEEFRNTYAKIRELLVFGENIVNEHGTAIVRKGVGLQHIVAEECRVARAQDIGSA